MIDPAPPVHRPAASERFFAEGRHIAERWNSTADTDVSVARARVEPGALPVFEERPPKPR